MRYVSTAVVQARQVSDHGWSGRAACWSSQARNGFAVMVSMNGAVVAFPGHVQSCSAMSGSSQGVVVSKCHSWTLKLPWSES